MRQLVDMTGRFSLAETQFADVKLVRRKVLTDDRGYLERLFCDRDLQTIMMDRTIRQINRTFTAKRGAVRGMHFQWPPFADAKLVTCIRGKVFDVVVDLRRGSKTFLQWHGEILSNEEPKSLFVPEGFAHGFQTMSEDCELVYLHTACYETGAEGAINAQDPMVSIKWPEAITELSPRDALHPMLDADFQGIAL